jgi:hypothetical protein
MAVEDKSEVTPLEDGSAVVTLADTSAAAEAFREGLPTEPVKTPEAEPKVEKKPASKADAGTDDAVANLTRQLEAKAAEAEEAKRRAAAAETQAQTSQREVQTHRSQREQAEFEAVTTALDSAKATMDRLEEDLAAAHERGDFKAVAKANREMAALAPRVAQLEDGKADMEAARKAPPTPQPRVEQQRPADPVEAYASQLAPEAAVWVRAHPEYVTNRANNYRLLAAHEDAVAKGNAPNSSGYFQYIETALGLREPESQGRVANAPVRERTMAAPVSRTAAGAPRSPREVTLTPAQREAAAISGISEIEYARQLIAGQ